MLDLVTHFIPARSQYNLLLIENEATGPEIGVVAREELRLKFIEQSRDLVRHESAPQIGGFPRDFSLCPRIYVSFLRIVQSEMFLKCLNYLETLFHPIKSNFT